MTDIQQAREWAEWADKKLGVAESHTNALAAARVIQSLPDQIIDAEKLREIYDRYRASEITLHKAFRAAVALTTPPLPTLDDLIEQGKDPKQYQWMQAEFYGEQGWITHVGEYASATIKHDGVTGYQPNLEITPLPGGAKMALPSLSVSDKSEPVSVETEDVTEESRTALPRPEDVTAGEPWLVLNEGRRAIGYRNGPGASLPWVITYQGCMEFGYCYDSDITLVSRLVPEVKP